MASIDKATRKTMQAIASRFTYMSFLVNELEGLENTEQVDQYYTTLTKIEGNLIDLRAELDHYYKVLRTITAQLE